mmetsp:Transcript_4388/g.18613  ORF Transcript_4388/g.18613 Transcript_4388/m.18613 type:complete len:331 (-) Transcript_4388:737-1729(-)
MPLTPPSPVLRPPINAGRERPSLLIALPALPGPAIEVGPPLPPCPSDAPAASPQQQPPPPPPQPQPRAQHRHNPDTHQDDSSTASMERQSSETARPGRAMIQQDPTRWLQQCAAHGRAETGSQSEPSAQQQQQNLMQKWLAPDWEVTDDRRPRCRGPLLLIVPTARSDDAPALPGTMMTDDARANSPNPALPAEPNRSPSPAWGVPARVSPAETTLASSSSSAWCLPPAPPLAVAVAVPVPAPVPVPVAVPAAPGAPVLRAAVWLRLFPPRGPNPAAASAPPPPPMPPPPPLLLLGEAPSRPDGSCHAPSRPCTLEEDAPGSSSSVGPAW